MPAANRPIHAWWDPPADGPTNMALDEALAVEAARRGAVLVRIAPWARPELSLGAFQPIAGVRDRAALAGLPVVRRPSGGGAIVHGSDITLCLAVPRDHPCGSTPQQLYDVVHAAFVEELRSRGVVASMAAGLPSPARPDPADGGGAREDEPFLCFDRRAPGDVVLPDSRESGADCKILGSAQRRLRGAVLQHGTLLLAGNADVPEEVRHRGLDELVGPVGAWRFPAAADLIRGWLRRLAAGLEGTLVEEDGRFAPGPDADFGAVLERFRDDAWTARR